MLSQGSVAALILAANVTTVEQLLLRGIVIKVNFREIFGDIFLFELF